RRSSDLYRFQRNRSVVPWRARTIVQRQLRWRARRPQLKRDPLGSSAMTMVTRSLLIFSLLVAGRAAPAYAQDEPARSGFWFGLGLGYGAASFTCNGCSGGPRLGGWALSFDLGATPSPHFRLGVGGAGWL